MSNVQQQQQQAAQSVEQLKKQAQANFGSAKSTIQDKASQYVPRRAPGRPSLRASLTNF